jgi:hypothetical protein
MTTKWDNFLKNLGEWRGSFTRLSLQGAVLSSTPSILNLDEFEENQAVRFRVRKFGEAGYDAPPIMDYQQEYRSLGRDVIFFATGAFSKGSLQLAPYAEFGAEYGFVAENRRSRLVQLFDNQGNFASLTLIREFRADSAATERPPLTVDQLLGEWRGEACTIEADWQEPTISSTHLKISDVDDSHLCQELTFGDRRITSTARIAGNQLLFETGPSLRQITLLPDGASSNIPLTLKLRRPFFVEAGWLVSPTERQRLIRSYNARGSWIGATHVVERKVA